MKILFLLFLLFVPLTSVDRGNFKKCDQSAFCRKNRNQQPEDLVYNVVAESVSVKPSSIQMLLTDSIENESSDSKLTVEIFSLEDNTVRVKIWPQNPTRERYELPVGDVLVSEPILRRIEVVQRDSSRVVMTTENSCLIVVTLQHFLVDFICSNQLILRLNSRSLLRLDAGFIKPRGFISSVGQWFKGWFVSDESSTVNKDADDEEETFKTHKDSKPYGGTSVGLDIMLNDFEFVYGLPEHADTFALKSTKNTDPYRLYNLDVFEYELFNPMALYGSVPYLIAHSDQRTVGVFWHNAAETWVDIDHTTTGDQKLLHLSDLLADSTNGVPQVNTHWFSESGVIDVFLMLGTGPRDVFRQYARLTGTTPLPPLFSLAYHQSRWNYINEKDVAEVNAGFDEHNIPVDVIWLDIEHTDGKRYFTWDKHAFPNPAEMIRNISAVGRKMVTIVDPHIRRDDNYYVYREAKQLGHLVQNKDGVIYEGWCWPGTSTWLDFIDPDVRLFWAENFALSKYVGSTLDLFTWNDMNEPSVFNGPEITMHKDAVHFGNWEHRDIHNVYGMYVHRASIEGQLLRSNYTHRPFVLSRAFFAGSQRYGAVWTGDNTGTWEHLQISIPMVLSLNLVGLTFSGADVGGFFRNPEPELLTRWYQAAAFQPFFRAHAHLDTRRREPWLLPPAHLSAIRSAITTRYRLLPYWYQLFHDSEQSGLPVVRPLWISFPRDSRTFAMDDQHMVGDALLVHPVVQSRVDFVSVYLPGADEVWYDFDTYQSHRGQKLLNISVDIDKIPVFLRGGFVLPTRQRIRRSSTLVPDDPYTLLVALDSQGNSHGYLYHDDFHSFNYRSDRYLLCEFVFSDGAKLSSRNINSKASSFQTDAWIERIIIIGLNVQPRLITLSTPDGGRSELASIFQPANQLLIIRKPGVNIATNFDIVLTPPL